MYRLRWTGARDKAHPYLVHRARAARAGGRVDAVRAEAARLTLSGQLLDAPSCPALYRAGAPGEGRLRDRAARGERPAPEAVQPNRRRPARARRLAGRGHDLDGRAARAGAPEALLRRG